jgi:hypothetical protein
MNLLSLTGKPSPSHTLLFNGDFVDRGSWSTEILLVLFAYKCAFKLTRLSDEIELISFDLRYEQGYTRTRSSSIVEITRLVSHWHPICVLERRRKADQFPFYLNLSS